MSATRRHWALAAAAFTLLLLLGGATQTDGVIGVDRWVERAGALRAGAGHDAAITVWQAISWSGGGAQRYVIVGLLAGLLGAWHHWRSGVVLVATSLLSFMTSEALKTAFARARPDVVPHLDTVHSLSFPSGHATSAAVLYLLFAMLVPTQRRALWLTAATVLICLTGWSRVALGVHWPSDVIGGWLLGGAFALIGYAAAQYFEGRAWQAGQPE
ncbi:MAG: phosphatase PAP2 family protein [Sphingopyxis sp.]